MVHISKLLLSVLLISLFNFPCSISFSKSQGEIRYELEEAYINNRDDLSWGEKVKARNEAYDRIFGKPDKGHCWLLCGGVILAIIIAVIMESKKTISDRTPKTHPYSDIRNAYKAKYHIKDSMAISSSGSELANNDETKKCPFCAEIIKKEAIVCRYYKRDLK